MKKLIQYMTIPLALTVMLTGCGGTDTAKEGTDGSTKAQNALEKVKAAGTLKIGTEGTYAPFTFHETNGGKLTGFDVEISEEVAKRLGVKAEFVEAPWDGLLAGLEANRFDAVANQVGIRPDRQEKYDFSAPYISSKAVLIVGSDNTDIKSFADLKGKKAAQSLTSNYSKIAQENGASIEGVDGFNQAIDLLASKRVDATINDSLSFLDLKKQKPDVPLKIAAEQSDAAQSGIAFRKGSKELVDAVNQALAAMKSDGTYLQISEKWFGTDVSK